MRKTILAGAAALATALCVAGAASATSSTLVERGLPTTNLNNAAGANRSNVAWSQGNDSITGDTFTVGSAGQTWIVTGIRTWNIGHTGLMFGDEFSDDTLYFGTGAIAAVATGTVAAGSNTDSNANITHTPVTYAGGSGYQAQDGSARQLWQNDFTNLNLTVQGATTYYFAVDGTSSSYLWFNHASNAALSGSTQQGADGKYVTWSKSDLATPTVCDSTGAVSGCNGGWDKSSDINVEVFASQVATDKNQCKNGGWQTLVHSDGTSFANQGDCVSTFEHSNGKGADDDHAHSGKRGDQDRGEHGNASGGKHGAEHSSKHGTEHSADHGLKHGKKH